MSRSPWYSATPDAAAIPSEVAERALEWLVELQAEPASPVIVEEWTRWRAAHPDHERAWRRIESVNGKLQPLLSSPIRSAIAQATLTPARTSQRRQAIKTLALLIFAGGAAWTLEESVPWRKWSADQRTAVGEHRALMLEDGTQLVLNTNSAIDIRFGETERRVILVSGEILVTTANDARSTHRSFLVETAQGTALALGTRYSVRQQTDGTEVGVFNGAVEIRPNRGAGQPLILHAGQQASYSAYAPTAPRLVEETSIAWTSGLIVARSMRLDAFIAELDRYSDEALSCDPAVAQLRVSGSFPLADVGKVLDTLSATLGVQIETVTRFWGRQVVRIRVVPRGKAG